MVSRGGQYYPVVDASFDHGASFTQSSLLTPPDPKDWGDRDFIAVGPVGTVYVTWDYGPERTSITYICAGNGSCAFATGDLNVAMQESSDGGKTWSKMSHVSPGFPASGGDSAPLGHPGHQPGRVPAAEPGGDLDHAADQRQQDDQGEDRGARPGDGDDPDDDGEGAQQDQ